MSPAKAPRSPSSCSLLQEHDLVYPLTSATHTVSRDNQEKVEPPPPHELAGGEPTFPSLLPTPAVDDSPHEPPSCGTHPIFPDATSNRGEPCKFSGRTNVTAARGSDSSNTPWQSSAFCPATIRSLKGTVPVKS